MTQDWKYSVGRSASGFGVWNNETGEKIKGFGSIPASRYEALKYLYMLNGWDWSRSKYVRENPWLRDKRYEWEEQKKQNHLHIDTSIESYYRNGAYSGD